MGKIERPRETFVSKFGFMGAMFGWASATTIYYAVGFQAIMYGGGAFWIVLLIAFPTVLLTMWLIDAGFGAWSRKAAPQAWYAITKSRFWYFISWLGQLGNIGWAYTAINIAAWFLDYMVMSPFGEAFWTSSPSSFFWDKYLVTFRGGLIAIGLWAVIWVLLYRGIGIWARFVLYARIVVLILGVGWLAYALSLPEFVQGMGFVFDFKPSALLSSMTWTQGLLVTFWVLGAGGATAYASYLPRGGDINDSTIMATISYLFFFFLFALSLPVLTLGARIPPVFLGGVGVAVGAMPQVFNRLGIPLLGLAFYGLVIFSALPALVGWTEAGMTSFMDKLGWTRARVATVVCVAGMIISSAIFGYPAYDAWNYENFGTTLIWAHYYWEAVVYSIVSISAFIILLKFFGVAKLLEVLNEASAIKLSPNVFKSMLGVGIILTVGFLGFLFLSAFGVVPAGMAGTILGDGTGWYGLTPTGIGILSLIVFGMYIIPALILTLRPE